MELNCCYCERECKNHNSLRNHQRLCKSNPEHEITYFESVEWQDEKFEKTRNQYTKAKELGLPDPEVSLESRKKISDAVLSRTDEFNKANGMRISKTINEKVKEGTWHTSLARKMHIDYNGVDLHGTWELKYAIYLDENNIQWSRPKESFNYVFEGTKRKYTPDFFLIETDEYVEIKGYKVDKDDAKWSQFPKDKVLKILMSKELKELGLDI